MNFNSKETYLAATAQWIADYDKLASDIRLARSTYKEAQRKSDWYLNELRAYEALKSKANEQLSIRHGMKEEAARQWQAHQPV